MERSESAPADVHTAPHLGEQLSSVAADSAGGGAAGHAAGNAANGTTHNAAVDASSGTGKKQNGAAWDFCPNCGAELVNRRCKRYCARFPACPYFMSCSDFDQ